MGWGVYVGAGGAGSWPDPLRRPRKQWLHAPADTRRAKKRHCHLRDFVA